MLWDLGQITCMRKSPTEWSWKVKQRLEERERQPRDQRLEAAEKNFSLARGYDIWCIDWILFSASYLLDVEIYGILKGKYVWISDKSHVWKKSQPLLGINSKNVISASTMSLACRDGERHLEGHFCINTWRAESGDDISFAKFEDP